MTIFKIIIRKKMMLITGILWLVLVLGIEGDTSNNHSENFKHTKAFDQESINETSPCDGTTGHHVCGTVNDGYYQSLEATNCSEFYRCEKHRRFNCTCGDGFHFDAALQNCISGIKSPPCHVDNATCKGKLDGKYILPNQSQFYVCKNGIKTSQGSCQEGQLFDVILQRCLTIPIIATMRSFDVINQCLGKTNGYHVVKIYSNVTYPQCRRIVACKLGRKTADIMCSVNGLFTSGVRLQQSCADNGSKYCLEAEEYLQNQLKLPSNPCLNKKDDGFYPNFATGCRRYYHCRQSRKTAEYVCTVGQLFDPISLQCSSEDGVICSPDIVAIDHGNQCSGHNDDGYYPNYENKCKSYYYCRDGMLMVNLACPKGKAFDMTTLNCIDEMTVKCPQPQYDCRNSFDGLYTDVDTGCTHYHVCVNNRLIKTGQCPIGQLFDRRRQLCEIADKVSCHDPDPISEGLQLNYGDQCNEVPVCFNNLQMETLRDHCSMSSSSSTYDSNHACKVSGVSASKIVTEMADEDIVQESYNCNAKEDGYYTDPQSDCRKWHACQGGQGTTHECPLGQAFDILYRRCEPFQTVDCANQSWVYRNHSTERSTGRQTKSSIDMCRRRSDGIYVDLGRSIAIPGDERFSLCFSVHLCVRQQTYDITCPFQKMDLKRNESTGRSTFVTLRRDSAKLPVTTIGNDDVSKLGLTESTSFSLASSSSLDCTVKPDGFYTDYEQGCHVFYRCTRGRKFSHYCKHGQLFNPLLQSCDFKENVQCQMPEVREPS